jgi:hypothetical protein
MGIKADKIPACSSFLVSILTDAVISPVSNCYAEKTLIL